MYYCGGRKKIVKVFISWSGERSKKIAETLKKWIKHVIQSIEPFVSSEDIQKGARWSTDIAKELQDSNFGILCVTKDNFKAPWLLFEAGALSKTMDKALVVPLLFDLRPSDLSGSPLLQFQATPFSKDEIKKMINTLNEANEKKLDDLDEVFEKWYPDLESALEKITSSDYDQDETVDDGGITKSSLVLEEILSLSRDNQKLLRNSESRTVEEIGHVTQRLERIFEQNDRREEYSRRRRKIHPMMLREIFLFGSNDNSEIVDYRFLFAISLFREDFPWIYDFGKTLFDVLNSNKPFEQKEKAIQDFKYMLEHSHYFSREFKGKEDSMLLRDLSMMLMEFVQTIQSDVSKQNTNRASSSIVSKN